MRPSVVAFALLLPAFSIGQTDLRIPNKTQAATGYGKILAVGDSITVGTGYAGGWRKILQDQLNREGLAYSFVGRYDPYAPMKFPYHEGHSGWTTEQILNGNIGTADGKLSEWLTRYQPQTVIVMIGTNDKIVSQTNHVAILEEIFRLTPSARVVVGLVTPAKGDAVRQKNIEETRAAQLAAVSIFKSRGLPIDVAETVKGFSVNTMLADDRHPNEAGYRFLANAIRFSLKRVWGF